jgi:hypothetical protein
MKIPESCCAVSCRPLHVEEMGPTCGAEGRDMFRGNPTIDRCRLSGLSTDLSFVGRTTVGRRTMGSQRTR